MRKMRLYEMWFLALFAILLLASILSAVFLAIPGVSLSLLLIDFIVAGIVAVYGSLSIREEEEEKH